MAARPAPSVAPCDARRATDGRCTCCAEPGALNVRLGQTAVRLCRPCAGELRVQLGAYDLTTGGA